MSDILKPGDRVEVVKVNAYHFGRAGVIESIAPRGKHSVTVIFDDGERGWFGPKSLRLMPCPGHEWEVIWEDGERSCCVCVICAEEKIFEHDSEVKP